jgi:hypothetical protein
MPIDTLCPSCQAKLRIGDEFAGQQARCPACDTVYDVPAANAIRSEPEPAETAAPLVEAKSPATVAELPAPDGTRWYLRTPEGPIYGPASAEVFHRWVDEGRVDAECHVVAGDNIWRPAGVPFPEILIERPPAIIVPEESLKPRYKPHRGPLILALGIIGIISSTFIPSFMAWIMGSHDLGEMDADRMDPAGRSLTQAGRFLGMVYAMILLGVLVIGLFVLVLRAAL